jgi:hypothetical protein
MIGLLDIVLDSVCDLIEGKVVIKDLYSIVLSLCDLS